MGAPGGPGRDPRRRGGGAIIRQVAQQAVDGFDRLFETARALGEETRFRIYRELCLSERPVAVSALAEAFSLHPNAIRPHLARLEQAGLVTSRADRNGGGAGRPRRLYEPGPEPAELTYPPMPTRALVAVLSSAVDALPSNHRQLAELGRGWGRSWAVQHKRQNGSVPRSRRGRAEYLARELAQWGWRPATRREEGGVRLVTGRCLFHDRPPGLNGRCCALEEGLLSGLVETLVNGHARVVRTRGCRLEVVL
jgi:predicted ArsR family transcriptional regulator